MAQIVLDVPHKFGDAWRGKGTVVKTKDVSEDLWDELVEGIEDRKCHYVVDPAELKRLEESPPGPVYEDPNEKAKRDKKTGKGK